MPTAIKATIIKPIQKTRVFSPSNKMHPSTSNIFLETLYLNSPIKASGLLHFINITWKPNTLCLFSKCYMGIDPNSNCYPCKCNLYTLASQKAYACSKNLLHTYRRCKHGFLPFANVESE
jgi:hypothetical protein